MGALDSPFLPGSPPARDGPLSRFLPPLEEGVVSAWLPGQAAPGDWVLDPFGSSPRLSVEAARAGYRVLVTANNPVTRFLLDLTAAPPTESELKAALADLAITKKGEERLEAHLQSLYLTKCSNCGAEFPARAFLWRKGEPAPYAREYDCSACGDSGERPVTPLDVERARKVAESAALHQARLLERVAPPDDPDREYAEEALSVYQPRAIYALATLINRLDAPGVTPERRRALSALFLSACDAAGNLWRVDNDRPRPRQLTVSNEFREHNVWLALEASIPDWSARAEPLPFVQWPNKLPQSSGILLFEGRVADLAALVKEEAPIAAVIGALPRPNQAFWTLCALWAGWLWGRESAEAFKIVLRRRRYDWGWQTEALHAAIHNLFDLLSLGKPFLGLIPEPEPAFLTAALAAADSSGFHLNSLALRTQHDAVQVTWTRGERLHRRNETADVPAIRAALRGHLVARGEPAIYLPLHAAGLVALTESFALVGPRQPMDEVVKSTAAVLQDALLGDESLVRYRPGETVETGLWGLARDVEASGPLTDRVEMAVVNFLIAHPRFALLELQRDLSQAFPGLLTPSRGLLNIVLNSYAEQEDAFWRLRPADLPARRKAEIAALADLIQTIGERLEYNTNRLDARTLVWESGGTSEFVFHLKASAVIGRAVAESPYPPEHTLVLIPAERASLLSYKLGRDPALVSRLAGIRFLKFDLIRILAGISVLNRQTFEAHLASEPIEPARGQRSLQ